MKERIERRAREKRIKGTEAQVTERVRERYLRERKNDIKRFAP